MIIEFNRILRHPLAVGHAVPSTASWSGQALAVENVRSQLDISIFVYNIIR